MEPSIQYSSLVDRYQRLEIKKINSSHQIASKWGKIRHRIPQGSILGLLLFLLYIDDLPNVVKNISKAVLFADDTSTIVTSSNPTNFVIRYLDTEQCGRILSTAL
jgi:hypothetical protein